MAKKEKIDNIRPLWQIYDNALLMKTGVYSYIFELSMNSIFSLGVDDYDKAANDFVSIFNLLPDFTVVHKMDVYTKKHYTSNKEHSSEDILSKGYFSKYLEKPFMNHQSYLIVSKSHSGIEKQSSLSSLIFKRNYFPKEMISKEDALEFNKSLSRFTTVLNSSPYFKTRELSIEESITFMENYENLEFNNSSYTSNIYQDSQKTKIGNKYISAVCVNSLDCLPNSFENVYTDQNYTTDKSRLSFSIFHPVGLDFPHNHIVNQVFIKTSKESVKLRLRKLDAMNITFMAADPSNELNLEDSQSFNVDIEKGKNPLNYHANVILWDTNQEVLDKKVNDIFAAFNKINISPNIGFNEVLPLFWSCYPGNAADLGFIDQTFLLQDIEAACLNVFETNNQDNVSPFGLYLNDRVSGCPLFVDISDLPMKMGITDNRNKIIIGPSGSGKSFTTNHMVNNYLKFDTDVVIVDVGDSYERLCKLRNGKYLKYTAENPISFNPFYILKGDKTIEKNESLVTLIFTLWKKNAADATQDEDAIIRKGLVEYYIWIEETDNFMCFDTYYRYMLDVYFPSIKGTKSYDLINDASFENVLQKFHKGGEYDYLLNSELNTDLFNEQLIVFELDNIKDHKILFPIVALMIMDTFITKMRFKKNTRKVILIEEAWKAIAKEGMAEFIKYLYKTVRKHFGEAIIVTQELDDILGSEIIKDTIIKNCGAKILLDMKNYADNFDEIQSLLSLTNKTKDLVLSINKNRLPNEKYKEVFIGLGNEGQVYGVNLSKQEYATYTTEKLEKTRIEELEQKFGSLELAIQQFAEEM